MQAILGWAGHIRVDNTTTYKWLGDAVVPQDLVDTVLTTIQITPTQTILTVTAGPIDLTITFVSPIEVHFLHYTNDVYDDTPLLPVAL